MILAVLQLPEVQIVGLYSLFQGAFKVFDKSFFFFFLTFVALKALLFI